MDSIHLTNSMLGEDLARFTDLVLECPDDLGKLERFENEGGLNLIMQRLTSHPTEGLMIRSSDDSRSNPRSAPERKPKTMKEVLLESPLQLLFHSAPVWLCLLCWAMNGFSLVYLICLAHSTWIFCSEMSAFLKECNNPKILQPKCMARVLRNKKEVLLDWQDVVVGDHIKIDLHQTFYADGILLHGSECIMEEPSSGTDRICSVKLPYSVWRESIHDGVAKRRKQKDLQLASPIISYQSVVTRGSGWVLVTALPPFTKIERNRRRLGYFLEDNFSMSRLSKKVSDTLIVWKIGIAITLGMACLVLGKHRLSSYNSGEKKWSIFETREVLQLITIWFILPRFLKNIQFRILCRQHLENTTRGIEDVQVNNPNAFEGLSECQLMTMNISGIVSDGRLTLTNFWSGEFYHITDTQYSDSAEQSQYHPEELDYKTNNFCRFSQLFVGPYCTVARLCFSLDLSDREAQQAVLHYMKASGEELLDFENSDWKVLRSQISASKKIVLVSLQNGERILTILHGHHREVLAHCESLANLTSSDESTNPLQSHEAIEELDQFESQGWHLHSFAFAEGSQTFNNKNFLFLGTMTMRPAVFPECALKVEDFYKGRIRFLLTDLHENEPSVSEAQKQEDIAKMISHSLMLVPIPEEHGFSFSGSELKSKCGGLTEFSLGYRVTHRSEFLKMTKDLVLITQADAQSVQMMITGHRNEGTRICRVDLIEEFARKAFQPEINVVVENSQSLAATDQLIQSSIAIRRRDLRLVHELVMASRNYREQQLKVLQYRITLWASVTGIILLSTAISKETLFSLPFLVFVYWVFDVLPTNFLLKERSSNRIWYNPPFKPDGALLITNVIYYIFSQIFFQTSATIVLFYQGPKFLPDNVSVDSQHFHEVNGNLLVRSGVHSLGWPDFNERLPSRHFTYLLLIFLFMQLGSLLTSRKIRGETNVLSKLGRSRLIWPLAGILTATYLLFMFGGSIFRLAPGGVCIRGWLVSSIFSFAVITWSLFVKALLGVHPD